MSFIAHQLRQYSRKAAIGKLVQQRLQAAATGSPLEPERPPPPPKPVQDPKPERPTSEPKAPILVAPESAALGQNRIEWFSDPHLLAKRVSSLVESKQLWYATDLIRRHKGAANSVVYGQWVNSLAKTNQKEAALKAFEEMKENGKIPTPQTYTIIFGILMKDVAKASDKEQIRETFEKVLDLWRELQESGSATIVHANAVLMACVSAASSGGAEVGMLLYKNLLANRDAVEKAGKKSNNLLIPDVVTYTTAFRLAAASNNNPMDVLEKDFISSKLAPDSPMVTSLLTYFFNSRDKLDAHNFRVFAAAAFNLPQLVLQTKNARKQISRISVPISELLTKHQKSLQLETRTLDLIFRFLVRTRGYTIGVDILDQLEKSGQLKSLIDTGLARTSVKLFCGAREYSKAVHFVEHRIPKLFLDNEAPIKLKQELVSSIAVKALSTKTQDQTEWMKTILEICAQLPPSPVLPRVLSDEAIYSNTITNCLLALSNMPSQDTSYTILAARIAAAYAPASLKELKKSNSWAHREILSAAIPALEQGMAVITEYSKKPIHSKADLSKRGADVAGADLFRIEKATESSVSKEEFSRWERLRRELESL
ncbi:hypothetical protein HDU79_010151 [Rhizoclosmatium sp. JEL0117]|nr:hypothetical protein HDU79_010151 [Rhizoclosmatium sp. JEL0117]